MLSKTIANKSNCRFSLKSLDNMGRFAGYASVFNVVDSQRDVIRRGAFTKSVKGRVGAIKLLWQHQQDEPIGVFDQMFEDTRGLYVEGRLLLKVQRAQEAHSLLKAGAINGLSIGYSPVHSYVDPKTGIRFISEVDLWEVSLVTFPANEAANVTVIKSKMSKSPPPNQLQIHAMELKELLDEDVFEQDTRGAHMTLTEKLERSWAIKALASQSRAFLQP